MCTSNPDFAFLRGPLMPGNERARMVTVRQGSTRHSASRAAAQAWSGGVP